MMLNSSYYERFRFASLFSVWCALSFTNLALTITHVGTIHVDCAYFWVFCLRPMSNDAFPTIVYSTILLFAFPISYGFSKFNALFFKLLWVYFASISICATMLTNIESTTFLLTAPPTKEAINILALIDFAISSFLILLFIVGSILWILRCRIWRRDLDEKMDMQKQIELAEIGIESFSVSGLAVEIVSESITEAD